MSAQYLHSSIVSFPVQGFAENHKTCKFLLLHETLRYMQTDFPCLFAIYINVDMFLMTALCIQLSPWLHYTERVKRYG